MHRKSRKNRSTFSEPTVKAPPSLFFPQKKSTFALPIGKLGRRGSIKKAVSKRKKRQKCFLLFLAAFSFVFLLKNVYTILKKKKRMRKRSQIVIVQSLSKETTGIPAWRTPQEAMTFGDWLAVSTSVNHFCQYEK